MSYNPFKVSSTLHRREVFLRKPPQEALRQMSEEDRDNLATEASVFLHELPEKQRKRRANTMIDQSTGRGRGGGAKIRLDRQRDFDVKGSLQDWSFTRDGMKLRSNDGELVKDATSVNSDNSNKLPLNDYEFGELPGYITEQIVDLIEELHAVPEDESEQDQDEDGEPVTNLSEHPTSENSAPSLVSG